MTKCILCNNEGSDDSKDGIPLHRDCWYSWLVQTHDNDVPKAVAGLHELYKKMLSIHYKSLTRY